MSKVLSFMAFHQVKFLLSNKALPFNMCTNYVCSYNTLKIPCLIRLLTNMPASHVPIVLLILLVSNGWSNSLDSYILFSNYVP